MKNTRTQLTFEEQTAKFTAQFKNPMHLPDAPDDVIIAVAKLSDAERAALESCEDEEVSGNC